MSNNQRDNQNNQFQQNLSRNQSNSNREEEKKGSSSSNHSSAPTNQYSMNASSFYGNSNNNNTSSTNNWSSQNNTYSQAPVYNYSNNNYSGGTSYTYGGYSGPSYSYNYSATVDVDFYCYHKDINQFSKFELVITSPTIHPKEIEMERVADNIIYARVTFQGATWRQRNELKYHYVLKSTLNYKCEEICRHRNRFYDHTKFFDTPRVFKNKAFMEYGSIDEKLLPHYFNFFIQSHMNNKMVHNSSEIFHDIFKFYHAIWADVDYNELFECLEEALQRNMESNQFLIYMIEVISQIEEYRMGYQYYKLFAKLARTLIDTLPFGQIAKIIDQENLRGFQGNDFVRGLRRLIKHEPLLGLQFIEKRDIIWDFDNLMRDIKDNKNPDTIATVINSIEELRNFWGTNVQKHIIQKLIDFTFKNSSTYQEFLISTEHFMNEVSDEVFQSAYKSLKSRISNQSAEVKNTFILECIDRIQQIPQLNQLMQQDIEDFIIDCANQSQFHNSLDIINKYDTLLTPQLLINLSLNLSEQSLDALIKLVHMNLLSTKNAIDKQDFKSIHVNIVKFKLSNTTQLEKIFEIYQTEVQFLEQPQFKEVLGIDNNLTDLDNIIKTHIVSIPIRITIDQIKAFYCLEFENNKQRVIVITDGILDAFNQNLRPHMHQVILDILQQLYNDYFDLITPLVRKINDFIFKYLQTHFTLTSLNAFDSDLIYFILKIGNQDNKGKEETKVIKVDVKGKKFKGKIEMNSNTPGIKFIKQVQQIIRDYINKTINQSEITLRNFQEVVIYERKYFYSICQDFFPNEYDPKQIAFLKETYNKITDQLSKYKKFLFWMKLSQVKINTADFEKNLKQKEQDFDQAAVRKMLMKDYHKYFDQFKSIDALYLFRNSQLFENIFTDYYDTYIQKQEQELASQQLQQQLQHEELKEGENDQFEMLQILQVEKIETVQAFDSSVFNIFIKKSGNGHLRQLAAYPEKEITYSVLEKYWKNIKIGKVIDEINTVKKFFKNYTQPQDKSSKKISEQLIEDISLYSQLQDYLILAKILQHLECFVRLTHLTEDKDYATILEFVKYIESLQGTENLSEIAKRIKQIEALTRQFRNEYEIDIEGLDELSRSQQTFEFAVQHKGENFNDLYERLDDQSFLTSTTITDMNTVSDFFNEINAQLESQQGLNFPKMLKFIQEFLNHKQEEDNTFKLKLNNCITNIQALQTLSDASLNLAENTLQIVANCLEKGIINIQQNIDKQYEIEIAIPKRKPLNIEEINQHCSRAILLVHSKKTDPGREEIIEKQVSIFAESVQLCQELKQVLKDLFEYGHLDFQNDYSEIIPIKESNIIETLKKVKKQREFQLQQWKDLIHEMRVKHYYLSLIPNRKLSSLINFLKNPNEETIENVFPILKVINNNLNFEELLQLPQMKVQDTQNESILNETGKILTQIFSQIREYAVSIKDHDHTKSKFAGTIGKIQYYRVAREIDLIRSIISLYYSSGYYPQFQEILFCNQNTQMHEIESFIVRSILSYQYSKREKVFVMANFQKLPLQLQLSAFNFMNQQESESHDIQFNLFILFLYNDKKLEFLIEELQGRELYSQYLNDEQTQKFFSQFELVTTLYSELAGLGKSYFAKQQITQIQYNYVRIPIFGELTRKKLTSMHKEKFKKVENLSRVGIHYDIYPTFGEDINIMLFEILILNVIRNEDDDIINIPNESLIFLESSYGINHLFDEGKLFFSNFKVVKMYWDIENLNITLDPTSDIQIISRYLQALDTNTFKVNELMFPEQLLSEEQCRELLQKYYVQHIQQPNYYLLNQFVAFASDQFKKMWNSAFFSSEEILVEAFNNDAMGLYREIVDTVINLSNRLSRVDVSQQLQSNALNNLPMEIQQVNRLKNMKWENQTITFIMLTNMGTIQPLFRFQNELPHNFFNYMNQIPQFKQEIEPFDSCSQKDLIGKIQKMCNPFYQYMSDDDIEILALSTKIVFTRDNFLKLAMIYLRIRAGQSVIIMGETGVGKTAIISYLSEVLNMNSRVLNLHAGITEQEIIDFVLEAQIKASFGDNSFILFFDEVNTNYNVQGLLKEIIIDKHIIGEALHPNIAIIAACNPYELKDEQNLKNSITAGIKHAHMDSNVQQLVYTVEPLPESAFSFLWDYGSLNEQDEEKYIIKLITKMNEEIGQKLSDFDEKYVASAVFRSQMFIKKVEAKWAVSLRDVARFCKLFIYFLHNNIKQDKEAKQQYKLSHYSNLERALVLSLSFCYLFRISNKQIRTDYKNHIVYSHRKSNLNITKYSFAVILEEEYNRYLDNMEIPLGIGRNTPLKENVFVILTCILNKIPLFITGKPGSSKTLAMNLVTKSMRGQSSPNNFFKKFPALLPFTYQGSVQSTSQGISRVFERAIKCQEGLKDENSTIVLVVIDEIGLAEISPHNPLKVLHSLLEPPKVATVGISNWALDASKMNRAITLSRPDPAIEDLIESGESISIEVNQKNPDMHLVFKNEYLDKLVKAYDEYYNKQTSENFHGLRDFYSLIQQICLNFTEKKDQNMDTIIKALERNFGGADIEKVIECFRKQFAHERFYKFSATKAQDLIIQNLSDENARHLMIITDHFENNAIQFIESTCMGLNKEYNIFYGSDFSEDLLEEAAYKQINDIILCMERGVICVLMNLENIYQSFYDMLNQNYQVIGGQRFCKVAIGADSSRCLVHPQFKCILLVDSQQVKTMDAPLLNRFEKQFYTEYTNLGTQDQMIIGNLKEWIKGMSEISGFTEKDMLPTLNNLSLQSLVLSSQQFNYGKEGTLRFCKNQLIQLASQAGMIRAQESEIQDASEWISEYKNNQFHNSLSDLLKFYQNNWQNDPYFDKSSMGYNLLIYTYSALITDIYQNKEEETNKIDQSVFLSSIHSKRQLQQKISQFFDKKNLNELLVIIADSNTDSQMRINLCRNIINNERTLYVKKSQQGQKLKNVCLIIKIDHLYQANVFFGKGWKEYNIDVLNGKGSTNIGIDSLLFKQYKEIIDSKDIFRKLLDLSLTNTLSKIRYNCSEGTIVERINNIRNLLFNSDDGNLFEMFKSFFLTLIVKQEDNDTLNQNWQLKVAKDQFLMKSNLSFHNAAIEFHKQLIIKYYSYIIYHLENDGVMESLLLNKHSKMSVPIFTHQFNEEYAVNVQLQNIYNIQRLANFQTFSYSRLLDSSFANLKPQFKSKVQQYEQQIMNQENVLDYTIDQLKQFEGKIHQATEDLWTQYQTCLPKCLNNMNFLFEACFDYFNQFNEIAITVDDQRLKDFIQMIMKITTVTNIENLAQIYSTYWINQETIEQIYGMMTQHRKFFYFDEFYSIFKDELTRDQHYDQLKVIPRQLLINAFVRSIYQVVLEHANKQKLSSSLIQPVITSLKKIFNLTDNLTIKKIEIIMRIEKKLIQPLDLDKTIIDKVIKSQIELENPLILIKYLKSQPQLKDQMNTLFSLFIYEYLDQEISNRSEDEIIEILQFLLDHIIIDLKDKSAVDVNLILQISTLINNVIYHIFQTNSILIEMDNINEIIGNNKTLQTIDKFISTNELNCEHTLILILCDSFEKYMTFSDRNIEEDKKQENLQLSINNIINSEHVNLNKIISVSVFRFYSKRVYFALSESIRLFQTMYTRDEILAKCLNDQMEKADQSKVLPLQIFIIKLFHQNFSLYQIYKEVSNYLPFILQLQFLEEIKYNTYIVQPDKELGQNIFNYLDSNNRQSLLQIFTEAETDISKRFTTNLNLTQHFYLNKAEDKLQLLSVMADQKKSSQLSREFWRTIVKQSFNTYTRAIETTETLLSKICTYTIAAGISMKPGCFLRHAMMDPWKINNIFIPFQVNVKDDFKYQTILRSDPAFVRYKCKKCGEIVCVVDCGALANHRAQRAEDNVGGTKCECGELVGYGGESNTERIDQNQCIRGQFKTDSEAVKGYIVLEPELNEGLQIRSINETARRVGYIIFHCFLLGGVLFSSDQYKEDYFKMLKMNKRDLSYSQKMHGCIEFLFKLITYNLDMLKVQLNLNEEKLEILIEEVIKRMTLFSEDETFNTENLSKIENRISFENVFMKECFPSLEDNLAGFFSTFKVEKIQNPLESQINENILIDLEDENSRRSNMYSLLRIQSNLTMNAFKNLIDNSQSADSYLISLVLDYKQSFDHIYLIRPLIRFANFIQLNFNGKVTFEDSLNCTIQEIMLRLNEDQRHEGMMLFDDFQKAWGKFTGIAIREGCQDINIPHLSIQSKFLFCCLTNTNRDSLGIQLYILIKYLALKQNSFLKSLQQMYDSKGIKLELSEVPILQLKSDHIIKGNVNEDYLNMLIEQNSFPSLKYGSGRIIHYNVEKIHKMLQELLVENKVMIDYQKEINFTFENIGNPYFQYEEIQTKIQQERYQGIQQILQSIKSKEDQSQLLTDIQVCMNFLQQTGGDGETPIVTYMKAFGLTRFSQDIGQGLRLKHILYFYECIEDQLHEILIKKVDPKYRQKVSQQDEKILRRIIEENKGVRVVVRNALARLCIRQLSYQQSLTDCISLFEYLFDDFNQYLFGIEQNINLGKMKELFIVSTLNTSQAYSAYKIINS